MMGHTAKGQLSRCSQFAAGELRVVMGADANSRVPSGAVRVSPSLALVVPTLDRKRDPTHVVIQMPTADPLKPWRVCGSANDSFSCGRSSHRDGADVSIGYQETVKDEAAIEAFQALGQETRLAALKLLFSAKEGMAAGDLATSLGVHPSSVTSHLNILARAGLVKSEKRGRFVVYSANGSTAARLRSFLDILLHEGA